MSARGCLSKRGVSAQGCLHGGRVCLGACLPRGYVQWVDSPQGQNDRQV